MVLPVNSIHKLELYFKFKTLEFIILNVNSHETEVDSLYTLLEIEKIFHLNKEEIETIEDSMASKAKETSHLTIVPSVGENDEDDNFYDLEGDDFYNHHDYLALFYNLSDSNSSNDSLRTVTQENYNQTNNIQQVNENP